MGDFPPIERFPTTNIAYGLWLLEASSDVNLGTTTLRDLTLSWLRFGYQGPVIESDSLETILTQALSMGSRACFIQTPGNIISEDWMLPHWQQADFHACLQKKSEMGGFLVCADIIATDEYFALDTTCLLIDLQQYEAMGRPDFGHTTQQMLELAKPDIASPASHLSTTQLKSTGKLQSVKPALHGWGFIDAALRHGLVVPQLPRNLSEKQVSLVSSEPNTSSEKTDSFQIGRLAANTDSQQRFVTGVQTQISRGRSGVFLWNIESYDDLPTKSMAVASTTAPNSHVISNLYCVAAGFKPNMLLRRHGFKPDSRVTFFDYSQQALNIRKTLLDEWDGTDYPVFCKQLMQRFPAADTFYQLWNGLQPALINWDDVDRLWENELIHWGGAQEFQQQWQAQCDLHHEFVHCDVVNNPAPLLEHIHDAVGTVIWWSNAFFTISSNWLLSIKQRQQHFQYWITELAARAPACYIYGADHINTPINGICASQYLAELESRSANYHADELMPLRQAAQPLRF